MTVLIVAVLVALLFDLTNGFHDSSNSIAALVVTREARPGQAVAFAGLFNITGPLIVGTAVADTVGGIVAVDPAATVRVVGAALCGAAAWNLITWRAGLPSSSSHALVGGLVGAALLESGTHAVHWGGLHGVHPVGVLGVLIALAVSPVLGFGAAFAAERLALRSLRRAHRRVTVPVRRSLWITSAALAFSHGANDAQKTMGIITLLLVATGHLAVFSVPLWVKLAAAASLTTGTTLGGWRIVRTIGYRIYRIRPLDGLVSQSSAAAIILGAAALGGPVSTTHVVASSVAGTGASRRRHHVHWTIVTEILSAWVVTIPASALLGAAALPLWRTFA